MKKRTAQKTPTGKASRAGSPAPARPKIHPVIVYPFRPATDYADLIELYRFVAGLDAQKDKYARPITIMDRKTCEAQHTNPTFKEFREQAVLKYSDLVDAWCVDTCQMWYTGLGAAFDRGQENDVYWLIPGDFNYGSSLGKEVMGYLHDLPEIILDVRQDFCLGEIVTDHTDSKDIIDTYGTYTLLYIWFAREAQEIRRLTEHPRSEFFAIGHDFLREALQQRWYPYEQTLILLLLATLGGRSISRFSVGDITDVPHGKQSLFSAVQQVERIARTVKMFWRERNSQRPDWFDTFQRLEQKSSEASDACYEILRNLLA